MKRWNDAGSPTGRRPWTAAATVLAGLIAISGGATVIAGSASRPASAGSAAGGIDAAYLFSDQGPMFDSNPEPSATQSVTVTLRTRHGYVAAASIEYYDSADGSLHLVPMKAASTDPTGRFDYWRGTIPAGTSDKHYRFRVTNGAETVWYNAAGVSRSQPSAGDFLIIPGFKTPDWMKNGVLYQIFADRFYDGDPGNDVSNGQYEYHGCATERHAWGTSVVCGRQRLQQRGVLRRRPGRHRSEAELHQGHAGRGHRLSDSHLRVAEQSQVRHGRLLMPSTPRLAPPASWRSSSGTFTAAATARGATSSWMGCSTTPVTPTAGSAGPPTAVSSAPSRAPTSRSRAPTTAGTHSRAGRSGTARFSATPACPS